MSKYYKIHNILHSPISIPISDTNAWITYPKQRFVYNRLKIAEIANEIFAKKIKYAPMPIEPDKSTYPIILKPITNLYGMGLGIHKINDEDEFYEHWKKNGFWSTFLEGDHISWDLIISNNKILFVLPFMGHKDEKCIGKFTMWETINCKPNNKLQSFFEKLVDLLGDYKGCLNIETINNYPIEVHLRMGDLDLVPTFDILNGVIQTYLGKGLEYNWDIDIPKTYFFPVWSDKRDINKCIDFCEKASNWLFENNPHIDDYDIDDSSLGSPSENEGRVMWFTTQDLNIGKTIKDNILKMLDQFIK